MKMKIVFDVTDAETIAASDSIGAFLRSADGTLLTHSTIGGKEALDVSIADTSITVTATDLDIRDLAFATDSVDVSGSEVSISGTVAVTQSTSPWVVSATDLDIRDLDSATDSVAAWLSDGSGNALTSTTGALDVNIASGSITVTEEDVYEEDSAHTSGDKGSFMLAVRQDTLASSTSADGDYAAFKVDATGQLYVKDADVLAKLNASIAVTATDLDIRDLDAASDSIAISDGTDTLAVNADGSINVVAADSALANTAVLASAATSTTTSASLALALANRKYLSLYNNGNKTVFIGQSGVSTTNGFPLPPGALLDLRIGAAVALHSVAQNGSQNLRALELS